MGYCVFCSSTGLLKPFLLQSSVYIVIYLPSKMVFSSFVDDLVYTISPFDTGYSTGLYNGVPINVAAIYRYIHMYDI